MKGFEIFGPVFTALSPGTFFTSTSMILLAAVSSIFFKETVLTGIGFSLSSVAFETPVTIISFKNPR